MFWSMLLFFVLGMVIEALTVLYMRASILRRGLLTAGLSGLIDSISLSVIAGIIIFKSLPLGIAWILGRMIGANYGTKINIKEKATNDSVDSIVL